MADVIKTATRDAYGKALVELAGKNDKLIVLDADLAAATKTGMFKKEYPDRFYDCGIAEANMMGVAAGLPPPASPCSPAPSPCSRPAVLSSRSATPSAIRT